MRLKISPGNSKLGDLPNLSLPPVKTCPDLPCKKYCYAVKAEARWQVTKRAWQANLDLYNEDSTLFFDELNCWLRVFAPKKFRWHVSGDIPDDWYFSKMMEIATRFPKTKFLVFTKRYEYPTISGLPKNLHVVLSAWPGVPMKNPKKLPVAYIDGDKRATNYIKCPGRCDQCVTGCFSLGRSKKNILMKPLQGLSPGRKNA